MNLSDMKAAFPSERDLNFLAENVPALVVPGAFSHRSHDLDMFLHEVGHALEIWTNPEKDNSRLFEKLLGSDSVLQRAYGRKAAANEAKVFAFSRAFYDKYKVNNKMDDELLVTTCVKKENGGYVCMGIQYGSGILAEVKKEGSQAHKEKLVYCEMIREYYNEFMTLNLAEMWKGICAWVLTEYEKEEKVQKAA